MTGCSLVMTSPLVSPATNAARGALCRGREGRGELLHGRRQPRVRGFEVEPHRVAAVRRNFQRVQDRTHRRLRRERHVGVPALGDVSAPGVATAVELHDILVGAHVLEIRVAIDLAEVQREALVLVAVDDLIGKEQHLVLDPRRGQFADRLVVERLPQVDAPHLGAQHIRERFHFDSRESHTDLTRGSFRQQYFHRCRSCSAGPRRPPGTRSRGRSRSRSRCQGRCRGCNATLAPVRHSTSPSRAPTRNHDCGVRAASRPVRHAQRRPRSPRLPQTRRMRRRPPRSTTGPHVTGGRRPRPC